MKSKTQTPTENKAHPAPAGGSRRSFLNILWTVLGLAALAEFLGLTVSFLRPAKPDRPAHSADTVLSAGSLASFAPGTVTAFQKGEFYLVRLTDGGLLALSCKCTHLGCTVRAEAVEQPDPTEPGGRRQIQVHQLACPCHGSRYSADGANLSGPAPRPLPAFSLALAPDDGQLVVDLGTEVARSFALTLP